MERDPRSDMELLIVRFGGSLQWLAQLHDWEVMVLGAVCTWLKARAIRRTLQAVRSPISFRPADDPPEWWFDDAGGQPN